MDALILILASLLPATSNVAVERVDVIERHTLLQRDEEKRTYKPVFSQYIFWRFSEPKTEGSWPGYHVACYRLAEKVESFPVAIEGGYRLDWFDSKENKTRHRMVVAPVYVVTECDWDPERTDLQFVDQSQRSGF